MPDGMALTPAGVTRAREHLEAMRCKPEPVGDAVIYRKHSLGRYGTFITHLSIL